MGGGGGGAEVDMQVISDRVFRASGGPPSENFEIWNLRNTICSILSNACPDFWGLIMASESSNLINDGENHERLVWSLWNVLKKYSLLVLLLLALAFTIYVLSYSHNETNKWKKAGAFARSLQDELNALGNTTKMRIFTVGRRMKQLRIIFTKDINKLDSSSDESLNTIRQKLVNVQTDISYVKTDVQEYPESIRKVEDVMATEKSKVWTEFKKLDEEIKNLKKQ